MNPRHFNIIFLAANSLIQMLQRFLFTRIDNSALIVFRWFFGLLIFLESVGAIFTGWVDRVMIKPEFTFSFIGFEWLQPLPGHGMYFYYSIMGIFGLLVMVGLFYRFAITGFTLMWTATYLMQKSSYNNHYYLLILICFLMIFMPAHRYASGDVRRNPETRSLSMPRWCQVVLIAQMAIAYTYGAVAKLYPHWWDGTFIKNAFTGRYDIPVVSTIFDAHWFHMFISYSGFFFDLLIVPLLLIRQTRPYAFAAAVFFHLFNSVVFQIGIFPYLSLALCVFFFPTDKIRRIFLKSKPQYSAQEVLIPATARIWQIFLGTYFLIQLLLPLRHHFIKEPVIWTEEGHRMSWRMMLRSKAGSVHFRVQNPKTGQSKSVRIGDYLSAKQSRSIAGHPDMIWQFAQRLKKEHEERGEQVEIYCRCYVNLNQTGYHRFIDPEVDLAQAKWDPFQHNDWILSFPGYDSL